MNALLQAALDYAAAGRRVIPLVERQKRPYHDDWPTLATTDADTIRSWWRERPEANVGIVHGPESNTLALDIDGPEGRQSLAALEARLGPLPRTATVRSGRADGGEHRIFRRSPSHPAPANRASNHPDHPHLEVLAEKRQSVAPPSIHPETGRTYELVVPLDEMIELPPAWAEYLAKSEPDRSEGYQTPFPLQGAYSANGATARERAYARAAFEGEVARVRHAGPGSRNHALNTAAYSLGGYVGTGLLDEVEVVDALKAAAKEVGDGGAGEDRKIAGTIRSGLTAGKGEPRRVPEDRHQPEIGGGANHDDRGGDGDDAEEIEGESYRPGPVPEGKSASRLDTVHGERFAAAYHKKLRHITAWGGWIAWDGKRWKRNAKAKALLATKAIVRASDRRCEAIERRRAALACAAVEAPIALDHEELDQRPTLLNLLNGTLDLETGKLRPHDPDDLITQLAPVPFDPTAKAPLWEAFLKRVVPDEDVRSFLQRASGYSLSGLILAHALFFCFGRGANGKSTFLSTLLALVGDYGMIAPPGLLIVRQGEPHPTEVADLFRRRLVVSHETGEDNRLNEERVKTLTGGDRLRARRMREDFWEFSPTHKLWLASNYQPAVRGTDEGMWRRVFLQPWTVTIPEPERDERMPQKLAAELPGILQWALRGWEDYQRDGLAPPAGVRVATNTYRAKADTVGAFLSVHVERVPGHRIQAQPLYDAYRAWAQGRGLRPLRSNDFSLELTERRGFEKSQISGRRYFMDCRFRSDPPQEPASGGEGPDV